jgi:scyllo-inositol 2-dehydrogenase (NADP+)
MTIRVGLIGYGLSGKVFHAPLIQRVKGLELVAVVSSNPDKVLRDLPDVDVVSTPEELLERKDIELVVIATPNTLHHPYAKAAIMAGKHVVVEKPFTITTEEADELIDLARQHRVLLSVYHNRRWDNDFLTVQRLIESGCLGELALYEAHYDRYRPKVRDRWREHDIPGAGTLYDLGSHLIDQALVLFGPPQTVWADLEAQRTGAQTVDYFHLVLDYGRLKVVLHSGSLVRGDGPRFQIHGEKGSFIKYGLDPQEDQLKQGMAPGDQGYGVGQVEHDGELTVELGGLSVKGRVETLPGTYHAYYEGIVEAIQSEKPAPVTAEEARNVIKVIECAIRSHREKRVVTFE